MSGINGYIQFTEHLDKTSIGDIIATMNQLIAHRSDDEVMYFDNVAGLGMSSLYITDLATGGLPISNETNTLLMVVDGEIYNYRELKQKLLKKGHQFKTEIDTEVILHAYEEYGRQCLDIFDGAFVFAIYDLRDKNVFIARDKAGVKPFYYYHDNNNFIFASKLKSLCSSGLILNEINKQALNIYLQLSYIPAPWTIFKNVMKLEAGHYLLIDESGNIKNKMYWMLEYDDTEMIDDYEKCKSLLRSAVFKSVEERLSNDVPIGTFLSGGIDSSIITAVTAKISAKKIDSFTVGFKEKNYNETDKAKALAEFCGVNHHVLYLNPEKVMACLLDIMDSFDEPFSDSSSIPLYYISQYASNYVKIVLAGDCGDELFAGYSKYLISVMSRKYNATPRAFRYFFEKLLYKLPDTTGFTRKARKVIEQSQSTSFEQRRNLMCMAFQLDEINNLLNEDYYTPNSLGFIKEIFDSCASADEINKTLLTDFRVVLEGDMLPKVDRMSRLCSLEIRAPFLSSEIINLGKRIPSKYKISNTNQKIILKDAFSDIVPPRHFETRKMGFGIPIGKWLNNELGYLIDNYLDDEHISDQCIFNTSHIQSIIQEHRSGRRDNSFRLWNLIMFQKWYKKYM